MNSVSFIFMLLASLSCIYRFRSDATINVVADKREPCVGDDELIPWVYSDPSDVTSIIWSFTNASLTDETVMFKTGTGNAVVLKDFNIEETGVGSVTLKTVSFQNEGTYKCVVTYTVASGHLAATGSTTVSVLDPPTGLGYKQTTLDSKITFTCTVGYTGIPSASLYIKVGNVASTGSSQTVEKDAVDVFCCLSGSSVACMDGNTKTENCLQVQWSTTTSSTITSTSSYATTPTVNASTTSTTSNPSTTTSKSKSVDTRIIIVACVVPFVTLLVFFFVCYLLRRRRNDKKKEEKDSCKVTNSDQIL